MATLLETNRPGSPKYDPPEPTPAMCELIRKIDGCDALREFYHPHSGVMVHECTHRSATENSVKEIIEKFLAKLTEIERELSCGVCPTCESPEIRAKIREAEDALIGQLNAFFQRPLEDREVPAKTAECKHIRGLCQ